MEPSTTLEPVKSMSSRDAKLGVKKTVTLGSVRHRDAQTNEIILIPTPSEDPNDPLNWYDDMKVLVYFADI